MIRPPLGALALPASGGKGEDVALLGGGFDGSAGSPARAATSSPAASPSAICRRPGRNSSTSASRATDGRGGKDTLDTSAFTAGTIGVGFTG